MTCSRCAGLIVEAHLVDEHGDIWAGYRCVRCGDYFDETILHHRSRSTPPEPAREHTLPVYRGT